MMKNPVVRLGSLLLLLAQGAVIDARAADPWVLPKDDGLQTNAGCFAELTCQDRIALARLAESISGKTAAEGDRIAADALAAMPGAQRGRITRAVVAGRLSLPYAKFTELSDADWRNVAAIENRDYRVSNLAALLKSEARLLAVEARSVRDSNYFYREAYSLISGAYSVGSRMVGGNGDYNGVVFYSHRYAETAKALMEATKVQIRSQSPASTADYEAKVRSYEKRIAQLSEQVVLEIEQLEGSLGTAQGLTQSLVELSASLYSVGASSVIESAALRGTVRVAAATGAIESLYRVGRAGYLAYARNDSRYFCELADTALQDPVTWKAAGAGLSTSLLSRLVSASRVGPRVLGGALGVAGLGAAGLLEMQRWEESGNLREDAIRERANGDSELAACFDQASSEKLGAIATDVLTLGAALRFASSSGEQPGNGDLSDAARRARLQSSSENQVGVPGTRSREVLSETIRRDRQAKLAQQAFQLSVIFERMETLDGFLTAHDQGLWNNLGIHSDVIPTKVGAVEGMEFVLENPATQGSVTFVVSDIAKDDALEVELNARQLLDALNALIQGRSEVIEL